MNASLVIATLLICSACSSMPPVDRSPERPPEQIIQGKRLQPGDRVKIGTTDGQSHLLQVMKITPEFISGDTAEIAILDVATVERLETTTLDKAVVGTAILTMSLAFWAALSALITAIVTLGL